ncbi:MAG: hypothetical protein V4511_14050 [Bacteroidota bacterium]
MKIVQVINAMITNKSKISNVLRNDKEYFFLYNGKYKWSITKSDNEEKYYIHFYPADDLSLQELSQWGDWEGFNYVTYSSEDLKTKEAVESFRELYQLVVNKVFGIDDIFDNIINDVN